MIIAAIRHDLRVLSRDGLALAVLAILVAALAFAIVSARSVASAHAAGLAQKEAAIWAEQAELEAPIGPTRISRPATLPPTPLAVLSLGRTRLDPAQTEVSFWSRLDLMFRDYQLASPFALRAGAFDLAFVVIVIAPLLIIALGAGLMLSDRDSGRLRILLATPARPGAILFARTFVRASLVIIPIVAAAIVGASLATGPIASALALWIGLALVYLMLWQAIVAFANTLNARADAVIVGLIALWALWIFLVPAITSAMAAALHPPPSRTALVADLRAAEVGARETAPDDLVRYMHDHPELQAQGEAYVAGWMRNNAMIRMRVEDALEAPAEGFETARARQDAIARAAEFASPALALNRALADTAGTGEARHRAFRDQARAYKARIQDMLTGAALAARPFSRAEADAVPRFVMREAGPRERITGAAPVILSWLAVTLVCLTLAARYAVRTRPM